MPSGGNGVQISWPASAVGYVLQSTAALPGEWETYADPGIPMNDRIVVKIDPISGAAFFRLSK
jgi:hypothetical protein